MMMAMVMPTHEQPLTRIRMILATGAACGPRVRLGRCSVSLLGKTWTRVGYHETSSHPVTTDERISFIIATCQIGSWRKPLSPCASAIERPPRRRFHPVPGHDRERIRELVEVDLEGGSPFKIFAVHQAAERAEASTLLARRYAWRGYSVQPLEPGPLGCVTLSATTGQMTVATITANPDAGDGLYVEHLYPEAVRSIRDTGGKLCEFTRFAVDESVRSQSLLGAIFHVACMYVMEVQGCTDALIEVHPRHVRFYEQMLGFTRVAEERMDPAVKAPAVLLRLDLRHCAREIDRLGGRREAARRERSFYPFFFARTEAEGIVRRLQLH